MLCGFSKAYDRIPREMLWYKLSNLGLHGNILLAIQALYHNVQCRVNVNNTFSSIFNVSTGLKQGCLISPQMFNIYINDLVTCINQLGLGINVGGNKISVLLYADDLVLLGSCAKDIQMMLSTLNKWCTDWGLAVNPGKTKVMHFRAKGRKLTRYPFMCGANRLDVVTKYKYLGLWFTEHLDLRYMADQIAASAQRALGVLIVKSRIAGGLPYQVYTKLYQSLVQSILDYGVCVWGHKEYPSIMAVQHRAIRSFLGVHDRTSTSAILGEMGWTPQAILQKVGIARQMKRLSEMDISRLNRKIYVWSMSKNCGNAAQYHKAIFDGAELSCMYDFNVTKGKYEIKLLQERLLESFTNEWYGDLNREGAKNGLGKNKLRTYRKFKFVYETEEYLLNRSISYTERKAFAKFRCSATALLVETGRYQNGMYKPEHERVCRVCTDSVENEEHVMMCCPLYDDVRQELFECAMKMNPVFNLLSKEEKFVYLMSSKDLTRFTAKACKLILDRHSRFFNI